MTITASASAPFLELDPAVSEAAAPWQARAREFARDVALPIGHLLDLLEPHEVAAPGSPFFDFMAQATKEGFTRLSIPTELGGLGLSRLEEYLVIQEIATGDAGLAAALFLAPFTFLYALKFGNEQLQRELCLPYFSGEQPGWMSCWAVTEPVHGSDYIAGHTPGMVQPGGTAAVTARLDDGEWVIDGAKSPWVSGGLTATHALVFCNLDHAGLDRGGIVVIPLDRPGVTRGTPLDKLGLRPVNQAQLSFEGVRVPKHYMLIEADHYAHVLYATHALSNASTALVAHGTGRAAYEGALAFAAERVQGGRPIIEHQATQIRLFRMFTLLEASRALSRTVYLHNCGQLDRGGPMSLAHSNAAKIFTTDASFEVCDIALQICAARGTSRTGITLADGSLFYPEKLLRDAKTFKIVDGENTFLSLIGASHLTARLKDVSPWSVDHELI